MQRVANRTVDCKPARAGPREACTQPAREGSRKSLRILLLSPHYPPDVAATGQLVAELAEDLVAAGHEAVVVAARPGHAGAGRYRLCTSERRSGVQIHWLGVPQFGRRGVWSRLVPFFGYFAGALVRSLFLRRIDVVFAQSTPPLLAGVLGRLLSLGRSRRFVYNLQDVYPDLGQALGVLGDGPASRLVTYIERRLRRRADLLVVLGDDMRERCVAADPGLDKVAVVPNWADTRRIYPLAADGNPFLREHALQQHFVVVYSGNFGRAHGTEILPEVAGLLADIDELVFLLIGDGPAYASLEREIVARGLANVRLLPFQPKERLHESLSAADVALILQRDETSGLVVPSKLYGILASGRAAVAAVPATGEVARVLRCEEAGLVVQPGNAAALAAAIRALHTDQAATRQMGRNARVAAVARYDRGSATARYAGLMQRMWVEA